MSNEKVTHLNLPSTKVEVLPQRGTLHEHQTRLMNELKNLTVEQDVHMDNLLQNLRDMVTMTKAAADVAQSRKKERKLLLEEMGLM